jgi:hypothetical protein
LDAWHGTLLMRIVDCSTAFFYSSFSNGTSSDKTATTGGYAFPPQVRLASVDTLLSMFRSTSLAASFWQSVFPGVFTSLYKQVLGPMKSVIDVTGTTAAATRRRQRHHGDQESRHSVLLEGKSLQGLALLLDITLSPINDSIKKSSSDPIPSKNDVLLQLTAMAAKTKEKNNKNEPKTSLDIDEDNLVFLDQIQNRVIAPLTLILRQKVLSHSEHTRKELVSLCRVLLLNTRECWHRMKKDRLANSEGWRDRVMEEVPMEICIALQRDSEGSYVSLRLLMANLC